MERIVEELGYSEIPRIMVFNKVDRMRDSDVVELLAAHAAALGISALNGTGVRDLLERIDLALPPRVGRPWPGHPQRKQPTA